MTDALLPIDLFQRFDHADGDELLASVRERMPAMRAAIDKARDAGVPVVYCNDHGAGTRSRRSSRRTATRSS
jgi:nicotinamidase-related amidase